MSKVIAGITTSVDGYVAGPEDGQGKGLGEGGEDFRDVLAPKRWLVAKEAAP